MIKMSAIRNIWILIRSMINYNLKIVFANKFFYFLAAAMIVFLLVTAINLFDPEATMNDVDVYNLLLVPGLLIVFYPTTFGIQNDLDTRMIEILFGIPNYRYKVWLIRLVMIFFVVLFFLFALSALSQVALTTFPPAKMVLQLMFPLLFMGCMAFMFSTLTRNGYGTAAIMIILGLVIWLATDALSENKWNVFLNPFRTPRQINELVWERNIFDNRLYLIVGSMLMLLTGLFQLQKREKFMR
jgi:hypothetical protein